VTDPRPDSLPGATQRIDTGWGEVYVIINDRDGEPFELFVVAGRSGGMTNTWCEALGKSISCALRAGADPEVLCDYLMGIRTDRVDEDNGDDVLSIPDAVGLALKRHTEGAHGESVRGGD